MDKLTICHLYPDLLNLYGDRGNIIAMARRLEWRNVHVSVSEVTVGESFKPDEYDLIFIGGGQDFEQEILLPDLLGNKAPAIRHAVESNKTFLAICGGYQLLGQYYRTWNGIQLDFTGAIDAYTIGHTERMTGNFLFKTTIKKKTITVVGFENHSGKTYLGESVDPLGEIIEGYGNNGEDKTEGARYKNVFCSYSHGPLLPKNAMLCDYILETALREKYGDYTLFELDDSEEHSALDVMKQRLR